MVNSLKNWYKKFRNLDQLGEAKEKISKLESELTEVNNSQRMFVHEARGTIGNAESFANLLEMFIPEDSENKEYATFIKNSAYKMRMILDAVGAATLPKEKLEKSYINFNPLNTLKRNAKDNKIYFDKSNIEIEINGEDLQIHASEPLIYTIVNTWLQNALRYTPANSVIKEEISESEKDITIKLENLHNGKPLREEIGLSEGLGTSFTKRILYNLGGKFETYTSPEINSPMEGYFKKAPLGTDNNYNLFGVKFTIPKK